MQPVGIGFVADRGIGAVVAAPIRAAADSNVIALCAGGTRGVSGRYVGTAIAARVCAVSGRDIVGVEGDAARVGDAVATGVRVRSIRDVITAGAAGVRAAAGRAVGGTPVAILLLVTPLAFASFPVAML